MFIKGRLKWVCLISTKYAYYSCVWKYPDKICFSFFLDHWHYAIIVVVQSLSCVHLFATPWTAAFQSSPATAKSLQSFPTLCDPIDGGPPGSPVPGILQARTLEWVAIFFSKAWKWKVKVKSLSPVRLFINPWKPTRLLRPWGFPGFPLQCFGLKNSMDSPWSHKESDTTDQLALSLFTGVALWEIFSCFLFLFLPLCFLIVLQKKKLKIQ